MFQYYSLVKKPLDQRQIATHLRAFQIQDKIGMDWLILTCSGAWVAGVLDQKIEETWHDQQEDKDKDIESNLVI